MKCANCDSEEARPCVIMHKLFVSNPNKRFGSHTVAYEYERINLCNNCLSKERGYVLEEDEDGAS